MTITEYSGALLGKALARVCNLEAKSARGRCVQSISSPRLLPCKNEGVVEVCETFHFVTIEEVIDCEIQNGALVRVTFRARSLLHRPQVFSWPTADESKRGAAR